MSEILIHPTLTMDKILDIIYPIGSIYITASSISPAQLFGGQWVQITGKFLLGATDNGATGTTLMKTNTVALGSSGGEAAHLMTGDESGQKALSIGGGGHTHPLGYRNAGGSGSTRNGPYGSSTANAGDISARSTTHSHTVSASNAAETHNNMPPFLAVNIWQRES